MQSSLGAPAEVRVTWRVRVRRCRAGGGMPDAVGAVHGRRHWHGGGRRRRNRGACLQRSGRCRQLAKKTRNNRNDQRLHTWGAVCANIFEELVPLRLWAAVESSAAAGATLCFSFFNVNLINGRGGNDFRVCSVSHRAAGLESPLTSTDFNVGCLITSAF